MYEATAKTYDQYRNADGTLLQEIERRLTQRQEGRYLDVGCGSGNYTIALLQRGWGMEGIDLSPEMLAQARAKAPNCRWREGDMYSLPFDPDTFDGVVTVNTLHYASKGLIPVFQEMGRVLKPGAQAVVFALALEQSLQFWLGHYFPFFRARAYKTLLPMDALVSAFKEASFREVSVEPFFVTQKTSDFFTYACKYRPHLFLNPAIRAGMTPLRLPQHAEEIRIGCERLEKDLFSGAIYQVINEHESGIGEGLFICGKK